MVLILPTRILEADTANWNQVECRGVFVVDEIVDHRLE